jgi:hypothetical protein
LYFLQLTEGAQIINAMQVVGMGVRIQDRINTLHVLAQGLLAQIRPSINQYGLTGWQSNDCRAARTPVPRVLRQTGIAVATNNRGSGTGADAQHD